MYGFADSVILLVTKVPPKFAVTVSVPYSKSPVNLTCNSLVVLFPTTSILPDGLDVADQLYYGVLPHVLATVYLTKVSVPKNSQTILLPLILLNIPPVCEIVIVEVLTHDFASVTVTV